MHACTVNGIQIGGDSPVRIMGVINCSPESFYRSSYVREGTVHDVASRLCDEGADILDIGGRSTAPGSRPISTGEEVARVASALRELDGCGFTISVDTMYPEVLEAALSFDIHAVNDIAGLLDPALGRLIAEHHLPAILMASVRRPGDPVGLEQALEASDGVVQRCRMHGIREYILDPGVGRWTTQRVPDDDWTICRNFSAFKRFDRPLLAAVSRKSFIGDLLGKEPEDRLSGSLALTVYLVEQGAAAVRTHDVGETRDVVSVCRRMQGWR